MLHIQIINTHPDISLFSDLDLSVISGHRILCHNLSFGFLSLVFSSSFWCVWCIQHLNSSWHCSRSHSLPRSSSCPTHPPFVNSPFHLHPCNFLHSHLLVLAAVFQIFAPFIIVPPSGLFFSLALTHHFPKHPLLLSVISSLCHTYKWWVQHSTLWHHLMSLLIENVRRHFLCWYWTCCRFFRWDEQLPKTTGCYVNDCVFWSVTIRVWDIT